MRLRRVPIRRRGRVGVPPGVNRIRRPLETSPTFSLEHESQSLPPRARFVAIVALIRFIEPAARELFWQLDDAGFIDTDWTGVENLIWAGSFADTVRLLENRLHRGDIAPSTAAALAEEWQELIDWMNGRGAGDDYEPRYWPVTTGSGPERQVRQQRLTQRQMDLIDALFNYAVAARWALESITTKPSRVTLDEVWGVWNPVLRGVRLQGDFSEQEAVTMLGRVIAEALPIRTPGDVQYGRGRTTGVKPLPDKEDWTKKRRAKLFHAIGHGSPEAEFRRAAEKRSFSPDIPYRTDREELLEQVSLTRDPVKRKWKWSVPAWLLTGEDSDKIVSGPVTQRKWMNTAVKWLWESVVHSHEMDEQREDRLEELYDKGWGLFYVRKRGKTDIGPRLFGKPLFTSFDPAVVWAEFERRLNDGLLAPEDVRRGDYLVLPVAQLDVVSMNPETGASVLDYRALAKGESKPLVWIPAETYEDLVKAMRLAMADQDLGPWMDVLRQGELMAGAPGC